jgi:outer membrane biosynthesis protein TonB
VRISDPLFNSLIPRNYFGGGKPPTPKPVKIPKPQPVQLPPMPAMPKFEIPKPMTAAEMKALMPEPVKAEPVPPPPTTSPLEAEQVADEEKRRQQRRTGYASSIIAGENPTDYASSATGTGSLLG